MAAPVETKVQASTAAAAVSGLALYALGRYVFKAGVPDVVASWIYVLVPGVITFAAGYLAKHTDRPVAVPPAVMSAGGSGAGASYFSGGGGGGGEYAARPAKTLIPPAGPPPPVPGLLAPPAAAAAGQPPAAAGPAEPAAPE